MYLIVYNTSWTLNREIQKLQLINVSLCCSRLQGCLTWNAHSSLAFQGMQYLKQMIRQVPVKGKRNVPICICLNLKRPFLLSFSRDAVPKINDYTNASQRKKKHTDLHMPELYMIIKYNWSEGISSFFPSFFISIVFDLPDYFTWLFGIGNTSTSAGFSILYLFLILK